MSISLNYIDSAGVFVTHLYKHDPGRDPDQQVQPPIVTHVFLHFLAMFFFLNDYGSQPVIACCCQCCHYYLLITHHV